jgi:hypothetical protein
VRFRSGFPEKIGGWRRYATNQFLGLARALWNWVTTSANNYLGVGTNLKYYVELGGFFFDVTPIVHTSTNVAAPVFYTTANSSTITVVDAGYQPSVGDYFIISGANTIANTAITSTILNAEHVVTSLVNSTAYTFAVSTTATNTANGGGTTVTIQYEYPVGLDVAIAGTGWGSGPWSRGTWGSAFSGGVQNQLRLWTNDNYGDFLFIAPRGGAVYYWIPVGTYPSGTTAGNTTRAQSLADQSTSAGYSGAFVPNTTNQVLASAIQRFIICMGANPYDPTNSETDFDPMLVRWSDQENPYEWVPAVTNQSGEFRLSNGSFIVSARSTRQEILVWTDTAIYSMQYLGPPYVWGFQILMDNISIISPNAAITANNITYWMGVDRFYMYSGRVETLPCSLWQYVYNDINKNQGFQVFAGGNDGYSEIWWFYCSTNSNVVDKYVIYNYLERTWAYGTMARTAWLDSPLRQYPMAADYNRRILFHEAAVDDIAGDTAVPINAYVQSSDFDIGDGHNFGFVWRILPDINFNGSNVDGPAVTMTVKPRQNSGAPYGTANNPRVLSSNNYAVSGVYNIQEFTGQVYTRLRGRQLAFRIESNNLGTQWQLGSPRIDIRNDGRR